MLLHRFYDFSVVIVTTLPYTEQLSLAIELELSA